jgi:hypothetical protein
MANKQYLSVEERTRPTSSTTEIQTQKAFVYCINMVGSTSAYTSGGGYTNLCRGHGHDNEKASKPYEQKRSVHCFLNRKLKEAKYS